MNTPKDVTRYALQHALGAGLYVALVAAFLSNVEVLFGNKPGYLGVVAFLLVFVISAAIMGTAIFARPIMWYLDGAKQEAYSLLLATLGFLFLLTLAVLGVLIVVV